MLQWGVTQRPLPQIKATGVGWGREGAGGAGPALGVAVRGPERMEVSERKEAWWCQEEGTQEEFPG